MTCPTKLGVRSAEPWHSGADARSRPADGAGEPQATQVDTPARASHGAVVWSTESMMRPGVRLGVDVGSVRVGVAASDPSGALAAPVATIARDLSDAGTDQHELSILAGERGAIEIVVGLPRSLSGEEGEAARLARAYATDLARLVMPTPVRLVDERLTTVESHRQLRESGRSGRSRRAVVDQAAAVLILQCALDAERMSGRAPGELVSLAGRPPRTRERRR